MSIFAFGDEEAVDEIAAQYGYCGRRNLLEKLSRGTFFWQNFLGCDKLFLGATSYFGVRLVKTGCDKLFEVVTFFFFFFFFFFFLETQ